MEYAKDEVYNIEYDNDNLMKKEGTCSIFSEIRKNSLIKLIIGITAILSIANFVCIYNFFSLLSKI